MPVAPADAPGAGPVATFVAAAAAAAASAPGPPSKCENTEKSPHSTSIAALCSKAELLKAASLCAVGIRSRAPQAFHKEKGVFDCHASLSYSIEHRDSILGGSSR